MIFGVRKDRRFCNVKHVGIEEGHQAMVEKVHALKGATAWGL
jgi:hypothetical protein